MISWTMLVVLSVALLLVSAESAAGTGDIWGWRCLNQACIQVRKDLGEASTSLRRCQLTCGKYSSLWPYPTVSCSLSQETIAFDDLSVCIQGFTESTRVKELLDGAIDRFSRDIKYAEKDRNQADSKMILQGEIHIRSNDSNISMKTDESYTMKLEADTSSINLIIESETYFGARHALETLSQLIVYDEDASSYLTLSQAQISDKPEFIHRGAMLDTSRHFYPVQSIKKLIDGLAMNKMNVFHWHITDTQSWPLVCPSQPNMTEFGAYSKSEIYRPEDVADLAEYALERGVKILAELDNPYHTSHGFEWTNEIGKGEVLLCADEYYKKGHLSPVNDFTYELLADLYKDVLNLLNVDIVHLGADEVFISCWNTSSQVQKWILDQGLDLKDSESFLKLWSVYQEKLYSKITEANHGTPLPTVVWTSDLTKSERVDEYLDKEKFVIQVWTSKSDAVIGRLLSKGYTLIISNKDGLYLDCGFGTSCSPYHTWQEAYDNSPYEIASNFGVTCDKGVKWDKECDQLLGSEACMWSEKVDPSSVEMKIWPRVAALAERLWSNPSEGSVRAHVRMQRHRDRMVSKGIQADAVDVEWCNINESC